VLREIPVNVCGDEAELLAALSVQTTVGGGLPAMIGNAPGIISSRVVDRGCDDDARRRVNEVKYVTDIATGN